MLNALFANIANNISQSIIIIISFYVVGHICSSTSEKYFNAYHIGHSHDFMANFFSIVSIMLYFIAIITALILVLCIFDARAGPKKYKTNSFRTEYDLSQKKSK